MSAGILFSDRTSVKRHLAVRHGFSYDGLTPTAFSNKTDE